MKVKNDIGIRRKLDDLGRIVIPKDMRKALHIKRHDIVEISLNKEGYLIVKPIGERCFCCGSDKNLKTINNISLCSECINKFKNETKLN